MDFKETRKVAKKGSEEGQASKEGMWLLKMWKTVNERGRTMRYAGQLEHLI